MALQIKIKQGVYKSRSNNLKNLPKASFTGKKTIIVGIVLYFVDDIIWKDTSRFKNTIKHLRNTFQIGTDNTGLFKYIKYYINQNPDQSITVDQKNYVKTISPIPFSKKEIKIPYRKLTDRDLHSLTGLIGQTVCS